MEENQNTIVNNMEKKIDNQTKSGQVPKKKIVPSYMKKENNPNKDNKIFRSKITKAIIIVIAFLVISILAFIGYKVYLENKYKKYETYEENMNNYGFNLMYNNSNSNTYNKVTKSELVKIVISSLLNTYDISDIWQIEEPEYENQVWVDYAEQNGLLSENEINSSNQNKRATYLEALNLLGNYKKNVLEKSFDVEGAPNFKDFDKYTNDQQLLIKDMVWNKILDNSTDNLKLNRVIVKGELNQLIIRFVEKYNTMTISSEDKININKEKLPYNYKNYTYTLANINKKIYEAKYDNKDVSKSILPKDMYIKYKDKIPEWITMINEYYNTILNVNYEKFDKNTFLKDINAFVVNNYDIKTIEDYQKYITENKISISGMVKVQMPIIYYDGESIRIRTRLQYDIITSNTNENLLFGDLISGRQINYGNDDVHSLYIDVKLFPQDKDFNNVYLFNTSVNELIVDGI